MRRTVLIVVLLAVAVGGGWWFSHRNARAKTDTSGTDPIPVLVATAEARDVPIWLEGLGTVQASATVTVKAQVDGMLSEVRFREGQDVHTGDILAKIDPRTYQAALDQATAKKAQDAANLANARVDLTRYTKLAATAYTSAQQADTQRSTVAQLEAQVAQDQAQIDSARAQLSYTTITSPIDGRTGIRQVDQGNLVHAADTTGIVVITTLRPIAVVFTLPQQALPDVVAAQAHGAPVVEALPQGAAGAQPLDVGTLAVLDNQVDPTTGTIKLKATFPNDAMKLWPGGFVTVRLRVDTRRNAIVVPPAAVQRGPLGAYVYVVGDTMTASRRPVVVGHEDMRASIIDSGLHAGERVVVDGAARLTDGPT
jgi:multidrug efflux system membrane fusion protein